MRTEAAGTGEGSGPKAPGRWTTSPSQVQSVGAEPTAARAGAHRPRLLPAGFCLPPTPGRGQVDLGVGREEKGAEDGDGVGPGSLAEDQAWQSPG